MPLLFDEVLEAVEKLSADDQQALIDILNRRLADEGRKRVIADVRESRAEHQSNSTMPVSVDALMREIAS